MLWFAAPKPRLTDKSYVKNYYYYFNNVWSDAEKLEKARRSEFQLTEHEPLWDAADAMNARAGCHCAELATRKVAIIGVGAVGSFVADLLVRGGVRSLTLVDHDVVLPGNLVRHLVDGTHIGKSKVNAVKEFIAQRHQGLGVAVETKRADALDPALTAALVAEHDLVINCTADF